MSNKHLINSVNNCVRESMYGFAKINQNISVDFENNIVLDTNNINKNVKKICLISGGGSGHEPFPAGYVGTGMLNASISGSIFVSPPSLNILKAIRWASKRYKEILLIIPNYTGDVLNFGLAAENANYKGIPVKSLVVGEDIAQEVFGVENKAGKRGTCGLIFIIKIAGYMIEKEFTMNTIIEHLTEILNSMATMGLCLSSCSKPGTGILFHLDENESELGIGVHGEKGVKRLKQLTAEEGVNEILKRLIDYLDIKEGDEVIAMINNLGSVTHLEMWLLVGELEKQLERLHIKIIKIYAGFFFTSLNMNGFQICLLKMKGEIKNLCINAFNYPTNATAWTNNIIIDRKISSSDTAGIPEQLEDEEINQFVGSDFLSIEHVEILKKCFVNLSNELIREENYLNKLDSYCGDGDCGTTFKLLANCVLDKINKNELNFSNPENLFSQLSLIVQKNVGGTTGALYGLFFKGISQELKEQQHNDYKNLIIIAKGWRRGIDTIKKYSTARIGDKTMLDGLETACEEFEKKLKEPSCNIIKAFKAATLASENACERTIQLRAAAGRASYVDPLKQNSIDPGMYAVQIWMTAILNVLKNFFTHE